MGDHHFGRQRGFANPHFQAENEALHTPFSSRERGLQTSVFEPRMGVCKPKFSSREPRAPCPPPPPRAGITILKDLGLENAKLVIPARAPSPPTARELRFWRIWELKMLKW